MGAFGTASGVVFWFNPVTEIGEVLLLDDGDVMVKLTSQGLYWDQLRSRLDTNGMFLQGYLYHMEPNSSPEVILVSKYAHRTSLGIGNYASMYTEAIYGHSAGTNFYPVKRLEFYFGGTLYNRYTFGIDGLDMDSERITSLANPASATDALNRQSGDLRYGRRWRTWLEAA